MSETAIEAKATQIHVADIIRHPGQKLMIPDGMDYDDVITVLKERKKFEDQKVEVFEDVDAFVWDGAYALSKVLEARYGWVQAVPTENMFGEEPPKLIAVETGFGKTVLVPWGKFKLPGVAGFLLTSMHKRQDGLIVFRLQGEIRRRFQDDVRTLANEVRAYVRKHSIYKGKAFKVRFRDEQGRPIPLPMPSFIDTTKIREDEMVFPTHVHDAIHTNLFTLIEHTQECRANQIPIKRGVMLEGDFGVGKTLVAMNTAKKCEEHDFTYVYCERTSEFHDAARFALNYVPAVLFCEDFDQVAQGERDQYLNSILNIMDGVDTKNAELIIVVTTNSVDAINKAAFRPGRMDAIIPITRPDANAAERLVRLYGRDLIDKDLDLSSIGKELADNIPAVIRETVERSKLGAIRRGLKGDELRIGVPALQEAVRTMKMQLDLLNREEIPLPSEIQVLGNMLGAYIRSGIRSAHEAAEYEENVNVDRIKQQYKRTHVPVGQ